MFSFQTPQKIICGLKLEVYFEFHYISKDQSRLSVIIRTKTKKCGTDIPISHVDFQQEKLQ